MRMGQPKALLPWLGSTFLEVILRRLQGAGLQNIVVVTNPSVALENYLPKNVPLLVNPNPDSGPIGSLQVGLRFGLEKIPWVMVVHVDHPAVSQDTYAALAREADVGGASMWAPAYKGKRGHPVVFSGCMYRDLLSVPAGEGARWAVGRYRNQRAEVAVEDSNVLRNVDTPADYQRLLEEYDSKLVLERK